VSAHTEVIVPDIGEENARYWAAARAHRLELPHCSSCNQLFYPPRKRCPRCLGTALEWRHASGRASLYSWIVVHQVYDRSFESRVPYLTAVVELEEGPRLVTNLVNCDNAARRAGLPVQAVFRDIDDELTLIDFEPEEQRS
jgi:hypothetical protein